MDGEDRGNLYLVTGIVIGLVLGSFVSWLQAEYGIVRLSGSGSFIIDAYPVVFLVQDVFKVFGVVVLIGFLAAWVPVRYVARKYRLR